MARRLALPFKDTQLKVAGPKGAFLAPRVQRLDVQTNFPSTDVDELGWQNCPSKISLIR